MKSNHPLFGKSINLNESTNGPDADLYMGLMVIFMGILGFILMISFIIPDKLRQEYVLPMKGEDDVATTGHDFVCNSTNCLELRNTTSQVMNQKIDEENIHLELAKEYSNRQQALSSEINYKFNSLYDKWGAKVDDGSLSIQFVNPDCTKDLANPTSGTTTAKMFFNKGQRKLSPFAKKTLKEFFPKYLNLINKPTFKSHILEIRIEGHTDSSGSGKRSEAQNYMYNMELSQDRARSVIDYIITLKETKDPKLQEVKAEWEWLKTRLTAIGMSSSQPVPSEDGSENKECSRRVVFRLVTDAEELLSKILKTP